MGMGISHVFTQEAFRLRDDTADSNEDAGWLAALNTNWTQETDTPFRIRFNVKHDNAAGAINTYMDLYYSHNGGTWTYLDNAAEALTTDSIMHAIESTNVAGYVESTNTTFLLGSTESLKVLNYGIVESNAFSTPNANWAISEGDKAADYEWCLTLRSSLVSPGDTIGIRVYYNDVSFDATGGTYPQDLTMTVAAAGNTGTLMKIKGATAAVKGGTLAIK
jgi:hypothetical protein